jgi:hypothetical protein
MNDMYTTIDECCEVLDSHSLNHAYHWLVQQEKDAQDTIRDARQAGIPEFAREIAEYLEKIQALLARVRKARDKGLQSPREN